MPRLTAVAALVVVTLTQPLAAQMSEVQPGAKVRVMAPGIVAGKYEGTVLTRIADTITLGGPNSVPVRIPLSRVSSLEISRGKSRSEGAITGIKWGMPTIGAFGAALAIAGSSSANCYSCEPVTLGEGVGITAIFALTGAMYGAGIGALIGREHWDEFEIAPRTSLQIHSGRIGLGLQFGF